MPIQILLAHTKTLSLYHQYSRKADTFYHICNNKKLHSYPVSTHHLQHYLKKAFQQLPQVLKERDQEDKLVRTFVSFATQHKKDTKKT